MIHRESITHAEEFDAPASAVWDLLADWGGILDWIPNNYIASLQLEGEGVGAIRHLVTTKDVHLSERLDALDQESGILALSLVKDLPWGLLSYQARGELEALSETKCRLTWRGTMEMAARGPECDRVIVLLKKSYANMFFGIRRVVEAA